MRWMKIVATTAALSLAAATLPATAQAGHYGHGYGYGYKPYHSKHVFVHKHRRSHGDALALGIFGLAAGAVLGSMLAQPRYPRHYYRAPAYAPVYGAPVYGYGAPTGSPDWYAACASKYRSFDPTDGTFQPYHGPRRLCQL